MPCLKPIAWFWANALTDVKTAITPANTRPRFASAKYPLFILYVSCFTEYRILSSRNTLHFYISRCICRSDRHGTIFQVRPSPRNPRPPDPESGRAWAHPRVCHRATHPADIAQCSAGATGFALPRVASPAIQEAPHRQVGGVGDGARCEVLRAHGPRPGTTEERD